METTNIITNPVLVEVKKAIDLFMDKTYSEGDFYSHILAIIRDNSDTGEKHKIQLERLIFKIEELRESQRLYWGGHKGMLGLCKKQEKEIDQKLMGLKTMGYSTDQFKQKATQNSIF